MIRIRLAISWLSQQQRRQQLSQRLAVQLLLAGGLRCAHAYNVLSRYILRRYGCPVAAFLTSAMRGLSRSRLVSRVRAIFFRKLVCLPLAGLLLLGYVSTSYIDYGFLTFLVQRQLAGRPVEQCLDLPEEYWIKYEKCLELYFPAEPDPGQRRGGVDSSDV
jgi:hypothetical protein